ncbi:MAG: response regulator transcription factor [Spirochaetales bacterium]|nr:response regulator transcription factor [Spirochaetales bacterium]
MKREIQFLVVDDHPVFRRGLVALIENERTYVVMDEVGSVQEALQALEKGLPDIALIDISLIGQSGLDLVKTIKASYPQVVVLIISMHDEVVYAERSLKAGARGYVMKHEAASVMKEAIKTVLSGKMYLSPVMRDRLLESIFVQNEKENGSLVERLSDRELDVLRLIGQGYGAAEIAEVLNLSRKTVNTYRENIKEKLSIPNAGELRRFAIKWVHSRN